MSIKELCVASRQTLARRSDPREHTPAQAEAWGVALAFLIFGLLLHPATTVCSWPECRWAFYVCEPCDRGRRYCRVPGRGAAWNRARHRDHVRFRTFEDEIGVVEYSSD